MALSRKAVTLSSFFAMSLGRLHHHHRLPAFAPSAAHSFSTGHFSYAEYQNASSASGVVKKTADMLRVVNELYCIRVDLPGLTSSDLKLWVDDNTYIKFEGKCKDDPKYEHKGRVYEGTIRGFPLVMEMDQLKAELKHGVLWITLPLKERAKNDLRKRSPEWFEPEKGEL